MTILSPQEALWNTERNLTSLIEARHPDAVLMTDWRDAVRATLAEMNAGPHTSTEELEDINREAVREVLTDLLQDANVERALARIVGGDMVR